MVDFAAIDWTIGIIALFCVGSVTYWVLGAIPKERLMRCPETGTITFVDIEGTSAEIGGPGITVQHCDLWPEHKNCARGCLARYAESTTGFRIRLQALRPFERRSLNDATCK